MKRVALAVALAVSFAAVGATPTPTPTRTPTVTATPVQGAVVTSANFGAGLVPSTVAGGDLGYYDMPPNQASDPNTLVDIQFRGGSNACLFVWLDVAGDGVLKENLTPTCLFSGASVQRHISGPGAKIGFTLAVTPTPNTTPISVIVKPNAGSIRVYRATPVP